MHYAQKPVTEELKASETLWSICYIFCKQPLLLSAFCSTCCERQKFSLRVSQVTISIHVFAKYLQEKLGCEEGSFMSDSPKRVKGWGPGSCQAPQRSPKAQTQMLGSQDEVQAASSLLLWGNLTSHTAAQTLVLLGLLAGGRKHTHTHTPSKAPWSDPTTHTYASGVALSLYWTQGRFEACACHMASVSPGVWTS